MCIHDILHPCRTTARHVHRFGSFWIQKIASKLNVATPFPLHVTHSLISNDFSRLQFIVIMIFFLHLVRRTLVLIFPNISPFDGFHMISCYD